MKSLEPPKVDRAVLRDAIREEYEAVALNPDQGFHFHTGRPLAALLGYEDAWLENVPETSIESFAGTGNPFAMGRLAADERVVDIGSGAGIDSLVASNMVGDRGAVIGVDMTPGMLAKARAAASVTDRTNVVFREGFAEELPVEDGWADVVISNGVFNLVPDKAQALREMKRVLKPGGRLQIADILVDRPVSDAAKERIELWTG